MSILGTRWYGTAALFWWNFPLATLKACTAHAYYTFIHKFAARNDSNPWLTAKLRTVTWHARSFTGLQKTLCKWHFSDEDLGSVWELKINVRLWVCSMTSQLPRKLYADATVYTVMEFSTRALTWPCVYTCTRVPETGLVIGDLGSISWNKGWFSLLL